MSEERVDEYSHTQRPSRSRNIRCLTYMSAQSVEVAADCDPATCPNTFCACRIRQVNLKVVSEELQKPDASGLFPRLSFACGDFEPHGAS